MSARADASDPAYGWLMVFVVFVLSALAFGALGSISVFLKPLSAEFGWTRGQTSLGYTAISFSSALFGVLWGFAADRFGTRWFGVVGATAMALSLYLLSGQTSIFEFYAFYFLYGAFGHAIVTGPLFANVGFWFARNPGLALGITLSGSAVGQGLIPFLVGVAISTSTWQDAFRWMAAAYVVIALPVAFLIRESPRRRHAIAAPSNETRDFPLSEVEVVAWISIAVIFCCNCMAVPIVHLVPLLTDEGRSLEFATSVLLVLMLVGALGRIGGGKLADTIGALPAYITMSVGQTVAVFWFPFVHAGIGIYLLAAVFGFAFSGAMASSMICARVMVSPGFVGRANGWIGLFGWFGMGMGGFVGGFFFDSTGGYFWSYAFASMMGAVNLVVLAMFFLRMKKSDAPMLPA